MTGSGTNEVYFVPDESICQTRGNGVIDVCSLSPWGLLAHKCAGDRPMYRPHQVMDAQPYDRVYDWSSLGDVVLPQEPIPKAHSPSRWLGPMAGLPPAPAPRHTPVPCPGPRASLNPDTPKPSARPYGPAHKSDHDTTQFAGFLFLHCTPDLPPKQTSTEGEANGTTQCSGGVGPGPHPHVTSPGPAPNTPVATFHLRMVLSPDADSTVRPSGEKATECTLPVWPVHTSEVPVKVREHRTITGPCTAWAHGRPNPTSHDARLGIHLPLYPTLRGGGGAQ